MIIEIIFATIWLVITAIVNIHFSGMELAQLGVIFNAIALWTGRTLAIWTRARRGGA